VRTFELRRATTAAGTSIEAETASANRDIKQLSFLMFSKACAAYPQIYPQILNSIASRSHDRF
jgi:hypothetical protein